MNLRKLLLRSLTAVIAVAAAAACSGGDDIDSRIDRLLSQMTLEEKIGQMHQLSQGEIRWMEEQVRSGATGSILNEVNPEIVNRLQHIAVEESRLGIPLLVARDVIHGFKTVFPIPIGQAATFDPELVEQGARIAAVEASAAGVRWTFSPMLDIARDPRWGRIAEGSGEDPYLASLMGAAMVRGYQTDDPSDATAIAACAKHFVGYGASEGGRDYNSTPIPDRLLANVYLPPFEAAVDAGALTLMTAFNEIDGIPCTGNRQLVTDRLRGEMGFDGMVVTDWNSAGEMIAHGYVDNLEDAAVTALDAGVDMDMMSYAYNEHLKHLVSEGRVSMRDIDNAVRNILRLKFRLGLFENPYVDESAAARVDYCAEHLAAAKRSASESAILLKNDNRTLPLSAARIRTLLVTGPMADAPHDQLGTWAFDGESDHTVTPLTALQRLYGDRVRIVYEPALAYSRDENTSKLARVTELARSADAVVAFVGEEAILSGEAHSLSNIDLQGAQSELLKAAHAAGKPVVAVVMAGRPLTIGHNLDDCEAMLYSFHPGTMGGEALAELLFGDAVPSGKTPVTFVKEVGQIPYYYNRPNTGRPASGSETLLADIPLAAGQTSLGCTSFYLDTGFGPLFPFGYGLSYTEFEYGDIAIENSELTAGDTLKVSFTIANRGDVDAVEVAQLYVRDLVGSAVRPLKELKRFARVEVKAGSSVKCSFELPVTELAFVGADHKRKVEPGDFLLWVAGNSDEGEPLPFTVR